MVELIDALRSHPDGDKPFRLCDSSFYLPSWDSRISLLARGVLYLMVDHPYRRGFGIAELLSNRVSHRDPEKSVRRAVKELETYGYLDRCERGKYYVNRTVFDLIDAINESKKKAKHAK